ncbi:hypothetical protein GCM10025864_17340 [Luteimicrobium album]|uniref:Uncharacterized protein n=1 Tax=Luteimicrobium album TaxID=1054550 RepID=A0ABQ6HZX2_9MICO|nr:hypothetical protein GCM10025864_17340 [Luteimicrobium album]
MRDAPGIQSARDRWTTQRRSEASIVSTPSTAHVSWCCGCAWVGSRVEPSSGTTMLGTSPTSRTIRSADTETTGSSLGTGPRVVRRGSSWHPFRRISLQRYIRGMLIDWPADFDRYLDVLETAARAGDRHAA